MSGNWGKNIRISIFGESHGKGIGVVLDGIPAGIKLDLNYINEEMRKRAPGKNEYSTQRNEKDEFEIISGFFNEKTTGTPICAIINNTNTISKDYEKTKNIMRPGHADYTGYVKYGGCNDYRGGGHFSGRLTAPLVLAGAICKQILEKRNIFIGSHILSIGKSKEENFDYVNLNKTTLDSLSNKKFPTLSLEKETEMKNEILKAKNELNSVGGVIETGIINMEVGYGDPFFDSIESKISQIIFSIPGVKGIEFGAGFEISGMLGSESNDEYYYENNKVKAYSNNNGGILGGISNGMPIIFKSAFKPTPSIALEQRSVDISNNENTLINIHGRHDPCIVLRAIPVVNCATAIAILDTVIETYGVKWMV